MPDVSKTPTLVASGKLTPVRSQAGNTDDTPLVSVLCMSYNQRDYLQRCLDAILAQEVNFRVEVLIHDDASTDGTGEIAQRVAEAFPNTVRAILQSENLYAKNQKVRPAVLPQTRGTYVAYCDGDDVWGDPQKLAKQVSFLEANPEFVISYHGFVKIDADDNPIPTKQGAKKTRDLDTFSLACAEADILNGTLMHRNVSIDFPPEFSLAPNGDAFFPVLLSPYGGAKYLPDVKPTGYRQHNSAAWSVQSKNTKIMQGLQSHFQIAAYLLRIGEIDAARQVVKFKISRAQRILLKSEPTPVSIGRTLKKLYSRLMPGSKV